MARSRLVTPVSLVKARVLLANGFASMTAYRAEIIIWMLSGTLALVMMLIWMAQASRAAGGEIGGYNGQDFASYFLSVWVTGQLLVAWVAWELDFQIRQGTLSPQLLRPLDPLWVHYFHHLAERIVRLPFMVLLVALFAWLTGAHFSSNPLDYLIFLVLAMVGFTMRFLWEYCTGLLAFWMESSTALSELNWLLYAALGGFFAPLSFYPPLVQDIARWTPFPYMVGLPAQLLAGKATLAQASWGLLVLAGWTVAFWLLRAWMWRSGLRRYGAVGA
ncbi:ABC transporter permease [Deinococcus sonorensis]|uniref:ABC-2 family transporter protein n=2 Tax=Deinococcus sonorensis TaxID=309891 RepID=A0AAU7U9Q3_9DEIO